MPPPLKRTPIAADPQNNRTVTGNPRASGSDPVGAALEGAGSAVAGFALQARQNQIAADITKAVIEYDDRLDHEARQIEADAMGEPNAFESRMELRAAEIAKEFEPRMTSKAHQRAWEKAKIEALPGYVKRMRNSARTRQLERSEATAIEALGAYSKIAEDPARPVEMLQENRARVEEMIRVQRRLGAYGPDVEAAKLQAVDETYRTGVSVRHVSNIDAMMDSGRYGEAEEYFKMNYGEVSVAEREAIETAIEQQGRVAKTLERADEIWAVTGGDIGKAYEMTNRISNPDDRLAAEQRINQLRGQDEASKNARQEGVREEMLDLVVDGASSMASIPARLMREADGFTRDYIQSEIRQRQQWAQESATMSAQQKAALSQISAISKDHLAGFAALEPEVYQLGPAYWPDAAPHLAEAYEGLKPEHRSQIVMDIRKRRAKGESIDAGDMVFKDVILGLSMGEVPAGASTEKTGGFLGIGATPSGVDAVQDSNFAKPERGGKNKRFSEFEQSVRAEVWRLSQAYAKASGGSKISNSDRKALIAEAFRNVDQSRFRGAEFDVARGALAEMLGREPTDAEVQQALNEISVND